MNEKARPPLHSSFITHHSALVKNPLAHVTLRAVGEERDDALARAESCGHFPRRGGGGAGRAAAEDALRARQFAHRGEGFGVRDGDDLVRRLRVEVRRDELALADAFEAVEAGRAAAEYGAFGLDERAVNFGVDPLDGTRDARERACGAAPQDDRVNAPVRLLDDLLRGRLLVEAWVGGVLELLWDEAAGRLRRQFARAAHRALHPLLPRDVLDPPAQRLHDLHLLARVAFGHTQNHAVAARDPDERQTDPGVPGGRLDDGRAGSEDAAPLGVQDHAERRAVFDRAAGVHVFDFGQHV